MRNNENLETLTESVLLKEFGDTNTDLGQTPNEDRQEVISGLQLSSAAAKKIGWKKLAMSLDDLIARLNPPPESSTVDQIK